MAARVLVTGANGLIGGFVMDAWRAPASRFEPVGLARSAGPNADVVADIRDLDAMVAACEGIEAIVHLAATSAVGNRPTCCRHCARASWPITD